MLVTACGRDEDVATTTAPAAETTAAAPTTAPAGDTTATTAGGEATTAPGGDTTEAPATTAPSGEEGWSLSADDIAEQCASEPLEATEVGVTADTITIEVMADTGSPLAPGLFQSNVDAVKAFADYVNANGGIGCRQLAVRTWDSKLDPSETKNGQIDACANAVSMVGNNTLYNPDSTAMDQCVDLAGQATGIPNMAALAQDTVETCSPMTFTVQYRTEQCPINVGQPRDYHFPAGAMKHLAETSADPLHGIYLVPGDVPTTRQTAISNIASQEAFGITFDAKLLISGRDEQASYTPRVQYLKNGSNYAYQGSDDASMVRLMKEASAQGVDMGSVTWVCSVACYTQDLLSEGGSAVEGAYMWFQFLPLDEGDTNAALQAFADTMGDKADTFGAQAWQAAIAFKTVVNQIVAEQGPNAITRANILAGFEGLENFTADGWAGGRSLRDVSPCYVLVQVQDGAFHRVWPEERGTLDCDPANIAEVTVEPVSAAAALG